MRRLVALFVSLGILFLLWRHIDLTAIGGAVGRADPLWLSLGLAAVIPLTLVTALRFGMLSRTHLPLGTATRLILSASTLNLVLPSKMGDIAKAWVLTSRYGYDGKLALALVVMEKMFDMASLLVWGVLALLWIGPSSPLLLLATAAVAGLLLLLLAFLSPLPLAAQLMNWMAGLVPGKIGVAARGFADEWRAGTAWLWSDRTRVFNVALTSLALWAAHLAQFWLFAQALGRVPFLDNMAFATLSILAGLLPFTMAGVGTRDAAIVLFYGRWLGQGGAAVLGVLATLRYILPAIAGLPFVRDFWHGRARGAEAA